MHQIFLLGIGLAFVLVLSSDVSADPIAVAEANISGTAGLDDNGRLNHYGDGAGLNADRGGFAKIALYESPKTKLCEPGHFDLNKDGEDDLLVFYWQEHLTAFIADNGSLPRKENWDRDWDAYFDKWRRTSFLSRGKLYFGPGWKRFFCPRDELFGWCRDSRHAQCLGKSYRLV